MKLINFFILSLTIMANFTSYCQNEADIDNTFNPNTINPGSNILSVNDKYLYVDYSYPNQILTRLNNDGSIDNTFNFTGNFNNSNGKTYIEIQSDGKIIVAGAQYNSNSKTINRFNSDGTIDNTFSFFSNISQINVIKIQNDGKILFGGQNAGNFGRVNSDGSSDNTFITGSNIYHSSGTYVSVNSIKIDSNNKILIGGTYNRYNGNISNGLTRLNNDGTFDNSFNIGTGFNYDWVIVNDIEVQNDGKIIVGGGFNSFNGSYVPRLVRLNSNGTKDNTFNSGVNDVINDIIIQNNDKIIIGGSFTTITGSINKNRICRFNTDGTIDNTFDILSGFDNSVRTIFIDNNNKIIISGNFSSYQGMSTSKMIRLIGESTLNATNFNNKQCIIYPNPVKETIYLSNITETEYEIFDILGKSILKGKTNVNVISVNSLSKGIYILKIKNGENITSQKFIKE